MSLEVKIPVIGESITEVSIATWLKSDGDYVEQDEAICEIESDKASVELVAEEAGVLKIQIEEGETVEIGAAIASIDTSAARPAGSTPAASEESSSDSDPTVAAPSGGDKNYPSPAAGKILNEKGIDPSSLSGSGKDGRITKMDALQAKKAEAKPAASKSSSTAAAPVVGFNGSRDIERKKMSMLRKTIAKRLVQAKHETAMLTTFNEVDMSGIMNLRKKYKEMFKEKHEIGLGFMSFFTKAVCMSMAKFPGVNAQIDGNEVLYHDYVDVGVAVSTHKGLVVPVVRNAESLSLAGIEKAIMDVALRARDGKLAISEMQGGTFTITNGGVFGSMLSTPIINYPQSAILGMHNIVQRPVAINGEVVIRPIMYLALSYDHRIVDGKESVSFLKNVKELLEDPARMLLDV